MRRKSYIVEGIALLALLLLVAFALRGNVVGRAISDDVPCKDGAMISSCMSDAAGTFLVEMSCERGRWREVTYACDCVAGPEGAACA
jgi:hypothetical protein